LDAGAASALRDVVARRAVIAAPNIEVSYFDAWHDAQFAVGEGTIQPCNVT
jgi:hypothetical protein